jgi:predicted Zn-dependent protease
MRRIDMKRLAIQLVIVCTVAMPFAVAAFDLDKIQLDSLRGMADKLKAMKPLNEKKEIRLGREVAANLVGAAPLVNDVALQEYVNRVGVWLALHTDRPKLPWRFGVLDTGGVNAFATPGGYIFITRGLLLHMRDEAELAGVLAHEISHVTARHALETMRKGALAGLASDALGEYAKQKGEESISKLVSAGTEIYSRGLDKEDEFAADRMGAVIAARAGYDPFALASVLQTLMSINPKSDSVALMFKTHPEPEKRLKVLVKAMENRLDKYTEQPRVADRFGGVMKAHVAKYTPAKPVNQ